MPRTATAAATLPAPTSTGGRLVSTDGKDLPLVAAALKARAHGGLARVTLEQTFRNPHAEPLRVTYLLPLPHDGAVSGFAFRVGDRRVVGEVDRLKRARERFERALVEGRTAALVEQDRTSLFTQEIGNVPPGETVIAELTVDQKLLWRADVGGWEWRFPATVSPRYQGAPGRVADAAKLEVPVADGPVAARLRLSLTVTDALAEGGQLESPSHALRSGAAGGAVTAALEAEEGVPLDRDVVVRWPVAAAEPGASLAAFARAGEAARAFGLVTLVPPAAAPYTLPRDLVLLFDVSGSMSGEPLDQSRRVGQALVDALGPDDRLEMIAFSDAPHRWKARPVKATAAGKREAHAWLAALTAGGATEMRDGIREALESLRDDAQRQVVLFTDGQIGFEREIVAELLEELPPGSRVHTVGVGSAVNRSLTGPAARAGRGREVVIGLGEDAERAARILVAHTAQPVVTEVEVSGSAVKAVAPARPGDLYAGAPSLVALELRPEGGEVVVRGRTADGTFERILRVPALVAGVGDAALPALFGREAVEDLEARVAAGEEQEPLDASIERLGLELQISTRLTSWVAISEEPTVDPGKPTRREVMSHVLPHGVSAEGLGLRAPVRAAMSGRLDARYSMVMTDEEASPTVARLYSTMVPPAPGRPRTMKRVPRPTLRPGGAHRAKVVLQERGRLVVEITLGADVRWKLPTLARLGLSGTASLLGLANEVTVIADGTTREGEYQAGVTLRVVLDTSGLPEETAPDLDSIELELPDGATLAATFR